MKLISLKEAKNKGLKHYFTGKKCPKNHISKRNVSSRSCITCDRQNTKKTRSDPIKKKKYIQKAKEYKNNNRDRVNEMKNEWYYNNKVKVSKLYKIKYDNNEDFRLNAFFRAKQRKKNISISTPKWENPHLSKQIYKIAKEIEKEINIKMAVDHIIPLKGKNVCGLNVWYNLTILPYVINNVKKNIVVPNVIDQIPGPKLWMDYIFKKKTFLINSFPNKKHFDEYLKLHKYLYNRVMKDNIKFDENNQLSKLNPWFRYMKASKKIKSFRDYLMFLPISY